MERIARFLSDLSDRSLLVKALVLALCTLAAGFIQWHESTHCIY